jgi:hypothetical protein
LAWILVFSAIADQTSHKKNFESVAKLGFQNFSWFGVEQSVVIRLIYIVEVEKLCVKN